MNPLNSQQRAVPQKFEAWALAALALYGAALLTLCGRLPFWVDEILRALPAHDARTWPDLFRWAAVNPGGTPLWYVFQRLIESEWGASRLVARLPSVISSVLACAVMFATGQRLGLGAGRSSMAILLFATMPLQFRYALEAGQYEEALFWSIAATYAFLAVLRNPRPRVAALYAATLAAATYTQPFAIFTGMAQMLWAVWRFAGSERRRVLCASGSATLLAAAAFLPWLLWSKGQWQAGMAATHYTVTWGGAVGMLAKDVGGTYPITLLLILGVALSFGAGSKLNSESRWLLFAMVIVPVPCAIAADVFFDYFVAARQLLFILPPLVLLAADGWSALAIRQTAPARFGLASLALLATIQDARTFITPRADFEAAARTIAARSDRGACVLTAPHDWAPYYEFFAHDLQARRCGSDLAAAARIVLVTTPYLSPEVRVKSERSLTSRGFSPEGPQQGVGGSGIRVFTSRTALTR